MAIERRPGDRPFLARVYVGGRKGPSRAFHTRHEAEAWHAATRLAIATGQPIPERDTPHAAHVLTVEAACRDTVRAMVSGAMRTKRGTAYRDVSVLDIERRLRIHILPRIGGQLLAEIDRPAVIRLREELMHESPATARDCVDALRLVFRRAVEQGAMDSNPAHQLPALVVERRKAQHLTRDEALALQARADAHRHPRLGLLVALAIGTGARRGELEALTWDNVRGRAIHVHGETGNRTRAGKLAKPKSASGERTIPVGPALWARLQAHRTTGPVIGYYPATGWREVRPLGTTFHDLRHTAATFWLAGGMNVHEVAELLGHADAAMVLRLYGHALPSRLSIAGRVMDDFLGGASGGVGAPLERMGMDDDA